MVDFPCQIQHDIMRPGHGLIGLFQTLSLWISVFFQFWPADKWTCSQMNSRAKQMSKNLDPEPRADKRWEHAGLLPTCCWPLFTVEVIYVYQECQSTWSLLASVLTASSVSEFIIRVETNNTHQGSVDLFRAAQLHLCGRCLFSLCFFTSPWNSPLNTQCSNFHRANAIQPPFNIMLLEIVSSK